MKEKNKSILKEVKGFSFSDDCSVGENKKVWNAQGQALAKPMKGGAYDNIISRSDPRGDESIEEAGHGEESESVDSNTKVETKNDFVTENEDQVEVKSKIEKKSSKETTNEPSNGRDGDSSDYESIQGSDKEDGSDDENDQEKQNQNSIFDFNSKALLVKTEELLSEKKGFPWVERFEVFPPTPLPFGKSDEATGMTLDVHDDLKREVAFHDIAVEAVELARAKCKKCGVPFSRPDDFFAEMVKSDEHMARVKDRLIFENKKIDAVVQRKSNREQKLRSKEAHANKVAEKSRTRKENLKAVNDWAKSAAAKRGDKHSEMDDQKFLKSLSPDKKRPWAANVQHGPNKNRIAANKKYGFGGKRGRFKQNHPQSMNDMSGFNPRGNFGGLGTKKVAGELGGNRKGNRVHEASRTRQRS